MSKQFYEWGWIFMFTLSCEFKDNIPVFHCDTCGNCKDFIESISYIGLNRGCCWYFPRYTLMDIKNIINIGKIDFIYSLIKNANSKISQYFIEVHGFYDSIKHKVYCKNNNPQLDFDSKLFFRVCPFVGKKGCTIDFQLRPHPCNLYLCREIIKKSGESYKKYCRERKDYYSYCNYFNDSLKYELMDKDIHFLKDFSKSLKIIKSFNIPSYEPIKLPEIKGTL